MNWNHISTCKNPCCLKWIKFGIIKNRIIPGNGKAIHWQLFLLKDNKGFLPHKKLLRFPMAKEIIDGKEMHSAYPCYYHVDPINHLKHYKIAGYCKVLVKREEENTRSIHAIDINSGVPRGDLIVIKISCLR